jgi:O-antigen ligase
LGIGWENIPTVLGKDERGANLNSSNIFLETYLGSGLIGFLSLLIILGTIFLRALISFFKENDLEQKAFALFIVISLLGIIIFNLFNAGIMLGFFWVWLGIASAIKSKKSL